MAARERAGCDSKGAINPVAAAVRPDDVALTAIRRAADDRPAHTRIELTPVNRQRAVGAFDRMRRQPDMRSRWMLDWHDSDYTTTAIVAAYAGDEARVW